jgi:hypothetical protein
VFGSPDGKRYPPPIDFANVEDIGSRCYLVFKPLFKSCFKKGRLARGKDRLAHQVIHSESARSWKTDLWKRLVNNKRTDRGAIELLSVYFIII